MVDDSWQTTLQLSAGPAPLCRRISASVIAALADGTLAAGDALPPTRQLARHLGVSRGVVVAAYEELGAAGFVEARTGAGTFILAGADLAAAAARNASTDRSAHAALPHTGPITTRSQQSAGKANAASGDRADSAKTGATELDLRPGQAEPGLIVTGDWRAAWRYAASTPARAQALSTVRHPELQQALATHLRRFRGIPVTGEDVVVVPGASAAFTLLAVAAQLAGRSVGVEEPGYRRVRYALGRCGALIRPVPVDADGLDPRLLHDDACVYVTPAHQYPLGSRMPVARRAELLNWAERQGSLIIEDDYDGEFRYGVPPMPAVCSMKGARDRVAYVGTASKVLTPDLGLAWVVPPPELVTAVRQAQDDVALGASPVAARALARLIDTGALSRHLARAGRLYRARRDALVRALSPTVPDVQVSGVEAGIHLVAMMEPHVDDVALVERLDAMGLKVEPLSRYYVGRGRSGLVIGYARLPESLAGQAVRRIHDAMRSR
ncbi:MAG: GntR family transcriptional regulator [Micrococcales bacterium]|nr:MAG: GntR family transcriptional regulator [Micrococcales bacterium]